MVYVTHDQEEAMTLGTRIAVMRAGRLEQVGTPLEVYERPATVFVARFVGAPAMNLWRASAANEPDAVLVGIRPHDVTVTEAGVGEVDGTIEIVEMLGAQQVVHLAVEGRGGTDAGRRAVERAYDAGRPRRVELPARTAAPVRGGEWPTEGLI